MLYDTPLYLSPQTLGSVRAGCPLGFSKPKAPERNKAMEAKQMALMNAQLKAAQKPVEIPGMGLPPPAPAAPPAPTQSSADAQEAMTETRRQAKQRSGIASTILAGDTGGYKLGGSGSILG